MKRVLYSACLLGFAAAIFAPFSMREEASDSPPIDSMPPPTEHRLDQDAERRHKIARKEWIESMHRVAPDVDWREIERDNGRREMNRRARMAAGDDSIGTQNTLRWTEIGSKNQAGRMHCAALGPLGPLGIQLHGGSSLGGVWRSDLNGSGWTPLADNLYGGAHEVVVVPSADASHPDVIVASTDGGELRATYDDGNSWHELESIRWIRGLETLQDTDRSILAYGGRIGKSTLLASTDRGQSFQIRWEGTSLFEGGIWVPRKGSSAQSDVYLIDQGRLLYSSDGGMNFQTRGVIHASATRGVLAGSEAGAPTLYAAVQVAGQWELYRSDDAGLQFSPVHTIQDFWQSLEASTVDSDLVMYGGVEVHRSANGGQSFATINRWWEYYSDPQNRLHADIPGIYAWPDPIQPSQEIWYICTDGGLFESRDGGIHVLNLSLSGLGVSQYYDTHTSVRDTDIIVAGSQDQGYQRGLLQDSQGSGPSTDFDQLISGDYGHLTSTDGTHDLLYSTYPGFVLIQEHETNPVLHTTDFPSGSSSLWLPPVVADPADLNSFFFLGDRLWRYTRNGNQWSPTLFSNRDFSQPSGNFLSALAFAPSDANRVYAVNDAGNLYYSLSGGVTWTLSSSQAPGSHYFYGNAVVVNPNDPLEAFVGGSGYSTAGVVQTVDGGVSFQALDIGLPRTLVYDLAMSQDGREDLYAATEAGPFHYDRSEGRWRAISEPGTPITLYWSVEAVADGSTIRFGTYGRGIWDYRIADCDEPRIYGQATPGGGGIVPEIDTQGLPLTGTDSFSVFANDVFGAQPGFLFIGFSERTVQLDNGIWLQTLPPWVQVPFVTSGPPLPGQGRADIPFAIPGDPAFDGARVYVFMLTMDPTSPSGFQGTEGVEVRVCH